MSKIKRYEGSLLDNLFMCYYFNGYPELGTEEDKFEFHEQYEWSPLFKNGEPFAFVKFDGEKFEKDQKREGDLDEDFEFNFFDYISEIRTVKNDDDGKDEEDNINASDGYKPDDVQE